MKDRSSGVQSYPSAKAYRFFREHRGQTFELVQLEQATGWKPTTIKTYIAKKWQHFLEPQGEGFYRVAAFDISEAEFLAQQTQVAPRYDYDVTVSFAGEDRTYVEQVAAALYALGIRVFYDRYEQVDLWGKDLYTHLDDVYRKRARYCVVFISQHYADKLWTNHERKSAQARAFEEKSEYILPVRFDATEVPGMLPTTGYIAATKLEPAEVALMIAKKTGMDTDLRETVDYLRSSLPSYEINIEGTNIRFVNEAESYDGAFPARLLVEMYRENMIDHMFIWTSILPY
ncbi:MAG TPA: TIR domain-containing protein [Pyrinomonadaceae bacterium]|nr:TIR domain-containing protein [Pyrinomonadaceae bacterium]